MIDLLGGDEGAAEDLAEGVTITGRRGRPRRLAAGDSGVVVKGAGDVWVKLAKCCTPVPGDEILGFVTKGGGVSVHRTDCTNAASPARPARAARSRWSGRRPRSRRFLVTIQVEALDRARLLSDITMVLSDEHVNILSAQPDHHPRPGRQEPVHLRDGRPQAPRHVLKAVRTVPGVFDAYRVTQ